MRIQREIKKWLASKGYLSPDVSLISLAEQFGTNRTYLTSIIQETYDCNLLELINRKRIETALEIIGKKPDALLMKELYRQLGYTSPSTFFRNFRRYTGTTTNSYTKKK